MDMKRDRTHICKHVLICVDKILCLRSSCWLVVMAALRRVLMRTALPLAEAFLDCRTVVRVSVILSLICVCIRIVRGYGAMHETPVTSQ